MYQKRYKFFLIISAIFAFSMAYLESSIVVYLRELYYPQGFTFPLNEIPRFILFTEIGREVSTIVMLTAFASLMASSWREFFAFFSFNFALWDIGYYLWLKVLLNWPSSLLEWDILFLIPLPWIAPVLAPVLVSFALIFASLIILKLESLNKPLQFSILDWILEIIAGMIIIISFLFQLERVSLNEMPRDYPWLLFFIGLTGGLILFLIKVDKSVKMRDQSDNKNESGI